MVGSALGALRGTYQRKRLDEGVSPDAMVSPPHALVVCLAVRPAPPNQANRPVRNAPHTQITVSARC